MIASAHLAIGAVSGVLVQKYIPPEYGLAERIGIGFCAGVLSHIVIDAPVHQEYTVHGSGLAVVVMLEVALVAGLIFYPPVSLMDWTSALIIFSSMAGAAFPDVLNISYKYIVQWPVLGILGSIFHFSHQKILIGYPVSIFFQVAMALAAILFLKIKFQPPYL